MKITRNDLKGSYSEGEALTIYNWIMEEGGDFISFAHQFIHDEDYQIARNAMWGMTKATDEQLTVLQPMLEEFIELSMQTDNPSVRRLSLNIIDRIEIREEDIRTDFLDFCLEHMANPEEYPGIQSLCMKQAYRICSFYPELMDELLRILKGMEMEFYKPAVRSVHRRILNGKYKRHIL